MGNTCTSAVATGLSYFFEYDTVKVVHIRSIKLGALNRLLQFAILAFVIGYGLKVNIIRRVFVLLFPAGT